MYKGMSKEQYVQLKKNDLTLDISLLATRAMELHDEHRFRYCYKSYHKDMTIHDLEGYSQSLEELRRKLSDIDEDISQLQMNLETGDDDNE
jgi:hypothetical protein